MLVIGYVSDSGQAGFRIGIAQPEPRNGAEVLGTYLEKIDGVELTIGDPVTEKEQLEKNKRDVVVELPAGFSLAPQEQEEQVVIYQNAANPQIAGVATLLIQQVFQQAQLVGSGSQGWITVEQKRLEAQAFRYVDFLVPGIIAMTIMQLGIFGTAFAIVDAKQKGVLRRVMATPVRPWQFVLGNMVARLVLSLMQAAILIAVAILAFQVEFHNWWWLIGLILLGNIVFLSLGLFVSGVAKTVETVPFIANLIAFPMMLLGGIFFPTTAFPDWLRKIVDFLPIAPLADLMRDMVTIGKPFSEGWVKLVILLVWAVVAGVMASLSFKLQERD